MTTVLSTCLFFLEFYSPFHQYCQLYIGGSLYCSTYRLMHALFHIKNVIILKDRYRPEGLSPRVDIGRGMIIVLIWKKACINLFIKYFNIELKRTKLISIQTPNLWIWVIIIRWGFCFRNANKSFLAERQHFPNDNWDLGGNDERLDIVLSEFCPDGRYRCGTSGVYVYAKLTSLVINMW